MKCIGIVIIAACTEASPTKKPAADTTATANPKSKAKSKNVEESFYNIYLDERIALKETDSSMLSEEEIRSNIKFDEDAANVPKGAYGKVLFGNFTKF